MYRDLKSVAKEEARVENLRHGNSDGSAVTTKSARKAEEILKRRSKAEMEGSAKSKDEIRAEILDRELLSEF